ncbi:hypothetical protein CDD83_178 [Cordyceps sp. RAO-2017]|nr:hypothetical protein CDD83_178 [Cordyceps sp. RAO-2017]
MQPGAPDRTILGKRPHASTSPDFRRTDFHWIVRDRNQMLWLSDLLNRVSLSQKWHRQHSEPKHPRHDINIDTYITARGACLSTHVLSYLLEKSRTEEHPASPLTGLLNSTHFGRPDFDIILDDHYKELRNMRQKMEKSSPPSAKKGSNRWKVGVFYCGVASVGQILADKCRELTMRGREDGSKVEYHLILEVFN